jgi:hypothetical protein
VDKSISVAAECGSGGPTFWCKDAATMRKCNVPATLCALTDGKAPPKPPIAGGPALVLEEGSGSESASEAAYRS